MFSSLLSKLADPNHPPPAHSSALCRTVLLRLSAIFILVILLEITLRDRVVSGPATVVTLYLARLGAPPRRTTPLSPASRAEYVKKQCNVSYGPSRGDGAVMDRLILFKSSGVKDLVLCVPPRVGAKTVVEHTDKAYGQNCYGGGYENGSIVQTKCLLDQSYRFGKNTVKAVLTRHPLDRLIVEYRRARGQNPSTKKMNVQNTGRKLLFLHKKTWKRKKEKLSTGFSAFVKDTVLNSKEDNVLPVSDVCDVCNMDYNFVVDLGTAWVRDMESC